MKKLIIPAMMATVFFASCDSSTSLNVIGDWQAVTIETPTQDSMEEAEMKMILEQINSWTVVPDEVKEQFKTNNLDSAKQVATDYINEGYKSILSEKEKSKEGLSFTFNSDGTIYRKDSDVIDTSYWYTAKDPNGSQLIIIDPFLPGKALIAPQVTASIFEVEHFSKDSLRLKIRQQEEFKAYISFKKK